MTNVSRVAPYLSVVVTVPVDVVYFSVTDESSREIDVTVSVLVKPVNVSPDDFCVLVAYGNSLTPDSCP